MSTPGEPNLPSRDIPAGRPGGVHAAAAGGYQRQADAYRRARPNYHPALVERIARRYRPDPQSRTELLELGAGTGIFTAQMAANDLAVTAVEPIEAMRTALFETITERHRSSVTVVAGTAEHIPRPDHSVGTVVAAQAFHWFDHGPALDEIARVLAVGGHLVTVWNVRDLRVPWVKACTDIIDRHAGDTPRHNTMVWRRAIDGDHRFEPVDDFSIDNPVPTTAAGVIDRVMSTSFIGALGPEERAIVAAQIGAVTAPLGDRFDYPYISELQAWRFIG